MNQPEPLTKHELQVIAAKVCTLIQKDYDCQVAVLSLIRANEGLLQGVTFPAENETKEESEWMDISTAPEGYHHPYVVTEHWTTQPKATYVLFANEHHAGVGFVQIEDDNDENDNPIIVRRYCDEHGDFIDTPLGWMELPSLPSPPVK